MRTIRLPPNKSGIVPLIRHRGAAACPETECSSPASITGEIASDQFARYDHALKAHAAAWECVHAALPGAAPSPSRRQTYSERQLPEYEAYPNRMVKVTDTADAADLASAP